MMKVPSRVASIALVVCGTLMTCSLVSAEAADQKEGEEQELSRSQLDAMGVPASIKRRDVFYDLEDIYKAELALAASLEDKSEQDIGDIRQDFVEVDTADEAIRQAELLLARTEKAIAARRWTEAMASADNGIALLARLDGEYAEESKVRELLDKMTRYRVQAEDAKLYEEAKAEFAGLGLVVEGIMWSADQPSSAIISGELHSVQDRVKNCLIVNIDTNRVDFMYTYKRRHYEFQSYIGESQ